MYWQLTQEIIDDMPNWQKRNLIYRLARELITLQCESIDEEQCLASLSDLVDISAQYGVVQAEQLSTLVHALHKAQESIQHPEVLAMLSSPALPGARVNQIFEWSELKSAESPHAASQPDTVGESQ